MAEGIVPARGSHCSARRSPWRGKSHALEVPARQIAENSGVDGGVVVEMRSGAGNLGFHAATGKYVDLVEAGIVDPTKVVRLALENAASVTGVLLLTEATTEVPEPKHEMAAAAADTMQWIRKSP